MHKTHFQIFLHYKRLQGIFVENYHCVWLVAALKDILPETKGWENPGLGHSRLQGQGSKRKADSGRKDIPNSHLNESVFWRLMKFVMQYVPNIGQHREEQVFHATEFYLVVQIHTWNLDLSFQLSQ